MRKDRPRDLIAKAIAASRKAYRRVMARAHDEAQRAANRAYDVTVRAGFARLKD